MNRDVGTIAAEIINDISNQAMAKKVQTRWRDLVPAAAPYLEAMLTLDKVDDKYGLDEGRDIILRALTNLTSYRGEKARTLKAELRELLR